MDDLTIDREFESLCGALSQEEITRLTVSIRAMQGCRDPIIVWANHQDTILDGHNRYRICKRYGYTVKIKAIKLDTREDALNWIASNQLGRRNLDASQRAMLAAKLESAKHGGDRTEQDANLHLDTKREEAAEQMNVSVRSVASAAKVIEDGVKPLQKAVETGEISVSVAAVVAELPPAQQKAAVAKGPEGVAAAAKKVREKKARARADDFDTKALDAKQPKNGAVRKEFDDHAVEQLFGKLIRLIDDRHAELGGPGQKYKVCVSTLRTAHQAWKEWCKS